MVILCEKRRIGDEEARTWVDGKEDELFVGDMVYAICDGCVNTGCALCMVSAEASRRVLPKSKVPMPHALYPSPSPSSLSVLPRGTRLRLARGTLARGPQRRWRVLGGCVERGDSMATLGKVEDLVQEVYSVLDAGQARAVDYTERVLRQRRARKRPAEVLKVRAEAVATSAEGGGKQADEGVELAGTGEEEDEEVELIIESPREERCTPSKARQRLRATLLAQARKRRTTGGIDAAAVSGEGRGRERERGRRAEQRAEALAEADSTTATAGQRYPALPSRALREGDAATWWPSAVAAVQQCRQRALDDEARRPTANAAAEPAADDWLLQRPRWSSTGWGKHTDARPPDAGVTVEEADGSRHARLPRSGHVLLGDASQWSWSAAPNCWLSTRTADSSNNPIEAPPGGWSFRGVVPKHN